MLSFHPDTALWMDMALLVLLLAVGCLLVALHLRLTRMGKATQDMEKLSASFLSHVAFAQKGLSGVLTTAKHETDLLEKRVREAQTALQDLTYVLARADKTFMRLEGAPAQAAQAAQSSSAAKSLPAQQESATRTAAAWPPSAARGDFLREEKSPFGTMPAKAEKRPEHGLSGKEQGVDRGGSADLDMLRAALRDIQGGTSQEKSRAEEGRGEPFQSLQAGWAPAAAATVKAIEPAARSRGANPSQAYGKAAHLSVVKEGALQEKQTVREVTETEEALRSMLRARL